jgi:hypothetical protein
MNEKEDSNQCCGKILKLEQTNGTHFMQLENRMVQHQQQMLDGLDKSLQISIDLR